MLAGKGAWLDRSEQGCPTAGRGPFVFLLLSHWQEASTPGLPALLDPPRTHQAPPPKWGAFAEPVPIRETLGWPQSLSLCQSPFSTSSGKEGMCGPGGPFALPGESETSWEGVPPGWQPHVAKAQRLWALITHQLGPFPIFLSVKWGHNLICAACGPMPMARGPLLKQWGELQGSRYY